MSLQRAALLAAIGALLRGFYFCLTNLFPSWEFVEWDQRLVLVFTSIAAPLAWAAFFVGVRRNQSVRVAALLAAAAGTIEIAIAVVRQYATFSPLSLDTMGFVFGTLLPWVCWLLLLLRIKRTHVALTYLMLACLVQFGLTAYQFVDSAGQIRAFVSIEPQTVLWRLVATPLIWMFYRASQALFVHATQKA
ncbi:MAG: hypothetical protein WDO18_15300 [Acidobacteriota bacterium]